MSQRATPRIDTRGTAHPLGRNPDLWVPVSRGEGPVRGWLRRAWAADAPLEAPDHGEPCGGPAGQGSAVILMGMAMLATLLAIHLWVWPGLTAAAGVAVEADAAQGPE